MEKWMLAKRKYPYIHIREPSKDKEEIHTKEGVVVAIKGRDYVAKGIEGELYPINKEIFNKIYEIVDSK